MSLNESWELPSENQEHAKETYYQFVRFQTLLCPFALQPETLPSVTHSPLAHKTAVYNNILFEEVKFRNLIDPRGKNVFLSSWTVRRNLGYIKVFPICFDL
jgi:hypothetical protein